MAKHEKTFVDFDKTYEQNIIGVKGILIFGAGLLALIVITFGLMFYLINQMNDWYQGGSDGSAAPMQRTAQESLPPEPRLQSAPGFGVQGPNGWTNLELGQPQSEYWTLQKIWKAQLAEGQKDPSTGTVISLPIDEAKTKLLEQNLKAAPLQSGQENPLYNTRMIVSDSSAGRMATVKRR